MLNAAAVPPSLGRGLRPKCVLRQDELSHRYRSLLLRILEAVAATTTKPSVGWADFASTENPHCAALEQEVFELSCVIANLTAIVVSQDGGVTFVASRAGDVMFWELSVSP